MSNDLYTTLMGNTTVSYTGFLLPIAVALFLGILFAMAYMYRARRSRSFIATLAVLPAVVCVVIMAVNGNIGAGVAVAGAFGLVRFRSAPGTAKEITAVFIAMTAGLLCGMGFLIYAAIFVVGLLALSTGQTEVAEANLARRAEAESRGEANYVRKAVMPLRQIGREAGHEERAVEQGGRRNLAVAQTLVELVPVKAVHVAPVGLGLPVYEILVGQKVNAVQQALRQVGAAIRKDNKRHVVIPPD